MEKIVLNAQLRETYGKGGCKKLRREGLIPCVVYKEGKETVNVQVDTKDLWHAVHSKAGENAIITMNIDGDKKDNRTVIVKEIQHDPLNDKFVHVDFHEISLKEKIKVKVPILAKGEAVGVVEEKGILTQIMWEIEVECLPTAIPEHIEVHVNELKIGDAIHVKEMEIPQDVVVLADAEQVVLSVNAPKEEEEEEPEEAVEGEEGVEPEVIKKGKKDEEEGEEGAGETAEAPQESKE